MKARLVLMMLAAALACCAARGAESGRFYAGAYGGVSGGGAR